MFDRAEQHLTQCDEVMRALVARIGPCTLQVDSAHSPYEALVRAVAYQQLHGRAAEAILNRFLGSFPGARLPPPRELLDVPDDLFRRAGFSRSKVLAIRDIAEKTLSGVVPTRARIQDLDDETVIAGLTQVRGVGRWTAEMLLIFNLGRPDVLPAGDFGIRSGFRAALQVAELPKARDVEQYGARWRPYRTTASWYLWRLADSLRQAEQPARAPEQGG